MKVVLDTNVIISGLLWKKSTKALFDLADRKKIKICLTSNIISEIIRVLNYPHIKKQLDSSKITTSEIINYLFQISEIFPDINIEADLQDSSDKMFLEACVVSQSKYLVTGDKHLLSLEKFRNIKILKPKDFPKTLIE